MTKVLLRVKGLRRSGLKPVELTLAAGEAVSVTGPSGAGKSLMLRALADLDPNEGDVALDGRARESFKAPEWRRLVTYVAANPAWWASHVGAHFRDGEREQAAKLLEQLSLGSDCLEWPVERLSTGEAQRIALARGLVGKSKVLLLDEPTASLDGKAAELVEEVLQERLAQGVGLIFVSHDPAQATKLAKRHLIVMAGGKVEERSEPIDERGHR